MASLFEKLKRLRLFYFAPKIALYWYRNPQHGSAIPSNPDKLSAPSGTTTLNRATAQNNAALSKAGSNSGLPAPSPPALDLSPSTLIDFLVFNEDFYGNGQKPGSTSSIRNSQRGNFQQAVKDQESRSILWEFTHGVLLLLLVVQEPF